MRAIWYLFRMFYAVGLIAVIPFFLLGIFAFHDYPLKMLLVGSGLAYFFVGWLVLSAIPNHYKKIIMRTVATYKNQGFQPECEVIASLFNRYMGFDPATKKILYVDLETKMEKLVDFHLIDQWEIDLNKNHPASMRLLTRIPTMPIISLGFDRHAADEWRARLGMIFG